jgi:hypothetical protein
MKQDRTKNNNCREHRKGYQRVRGEQCDWGKVYLERRSESTCGDATRQTESDEPPLLESGFATNNG